MGDFNTLVKSGGYERMVSVKEGEGIFEVYFATGDTKHFLINILSISNNDCVLLSIVGDLDMNKIAMLAKNNTPN